MHAVRPVRIRLTGILAAVALGAALSACGSDEPGSAADQDPGATSSSPTEATESSPTDEPSVVDDGGQIDVNVFVDRIKAGIEATEQGHIEVTMSGAGGEMTGSGDADYTAKPVNMQMALDIGPESVEMVLVDGTMYVRSSQAGDKYLAFDLSEPNNPLGPEFAEQLDPTASMATFASAVSSVTSAGTEEVDGQSLDRYDLVVDTTKLTDKSQAAQLPPEVSLTVWLDDLDRMAKTVMNMGAITYETTLSDLDEPVDIKAPPADQIATPPAG